MMKINAHIRNVVAIMWSLFSLLYAQSAPPSNHLDVRAMDALGIGDNKWWAETQSIIRDRKNPAMRMEMAQYLLSRPIVWKEGHPRDSETRTATMQLAAEVRAAIAPHFAAVPNDRLIFSSEEYRRALLAALNPTALASPQPNPMEPESTADSAIASVESHSQSKMSGESKGLRPIAVPEVMPSRPSESKPSRWTIAIVSIIAAIGLLWWLLKRKNSKGGTGNVETP